MYDATGRVIEVALSNDGIRIVKDFSDKAPKEIRDDIRKYIDKLN